MSNSLPTLTSNACARPTGDLGLSDLYHVKPMPVVSSMPYLFSKPHLVQSRILAVNGRRGGSRQLVALLRQRLGQIVWVPIQDHSIVSSCLHSFSRKASMWVLGNLAHCLGTRPVCGPTIGQQIIVRLCYGGRAQKILSQLEGTHRLRYGFHSLGAVSHHQGAGNMSGSSES